MAYSLAWLPQVLYWQNFERLMFELIYKNKSVSDIPAKIWERYSRFDAFFQASTWP